MKKVMVFGSFDHLHPGHLFFLREAKNHGDFLIVVLGRDKTIEKLKGKPPKYSIEERKKHLEIAGIADQIIFGKERDPFEVIQDFKPDIICLGYDQNSFTFTLKEELIKRNINAQIVRLSPFKEHLFKSSKLKKS